MGQSWLVQEEFAVVVLDRMLSRILHTCQKAVEASAPGLLELST